MLGVFLPLDELPSRVVDPHLPEAAGFKAPETRLLPFLPSVEAVSPRAGWSVDLLSEAVVLRTPLRVFCKQWELIPKATPGYDNHLKPVETITVKQV